jgi:hypothetical protein
MVDQHRRARTELGQPGGTVGPDRDDRVVGFDRRVTQHQRTTLGPTDQVPARAHRDGVPRIGPGGDGEAHTRVWVPSRPNRNDHREIHENVR